MKKTHPHKNVTQNQHPKNNTKKPKNTKNTSQKNTKKITLDKRILF